ncbi:hypothetical protein [Clostridium cylindrosporum]|uniref:Uncharacterized protein n=1 Tax=Clostridium cylindrosporum DSM 605 TaxID=1121307 RepID=A0A0J8DBZ6_CLOCY|nr:hypothetical protein [Clostridium cylindrosporum]KMT21803.1 hypothetical protein CLCY_3c00700 [Clostridium cylindrosporum DSM 605]
MTVLREKKTWIAMSLLIITVLLIMTILLLLHMKDKKDENYKKEKFNSVYYTKPVQFNNSDIDFEYSQFQGKTQSKKYNNLESLENQIGFKVLHSNYFSNDNFEVVYIKDVGFSEIYQVPKASLKSYGKDFDKIGISSFLNDITEPYVKMTIINNKDTKGIPTEYMGYYEIQDVFSLSNGKEVQLIKEYNRTGDYERYIIVFNHNNVVYTVEYIPDLDSARNIANSFFK